MFWLVLAIVLTLTTSFFCSLFEALILSTTVAEVEELKKKHALRGQLLEQVKFEIDETISAILTLNTIANSLGSVVIGALGAPLFGETLPAVLSGVFGLLLLRRSGV